MSYGAGVVDKHIGNKLPNPAIQNIIGVHRQIRSYRVKIKRRSTGKPLGQIDQNRDSDYIKNHRIITITERFLEYVHYLTISRGRFSFKYADIIVMLRRALYPLILLLCLPLSAQEVLRGEVKIEMEQVRGFPVEETKIQVLLSITEARAAALEESALYFGAMIYGWSFYYDVGERARNIEEKLELTPLGVINSGDSRLEITEVQVKDLNLYLWTDYRPDTAQYNRLGKWRAGTVRSAQAYGESPLEDKYAALEDAARAAIRAMLRGDERNRPKEVTGFISLAAFPRYWIEKGHWTALGRFRVEIVKIEPFAAY
jgi:hypothetical protein